MKEIIRPASSPSLKERMCSWQVHVSSRGPWGTPPIINPHEPQIPSRQSCSKAIGSWPGQMRTIFGDHNRFSYNFV